MGEIKQLAIASVPMQEWNEVYDDDHAFETGTIFPELNRPFFVTALDSSEPKAHLELNREQNLLLQIQKVGFVLDDLRLYMDTHPEDKEGLKLLKSTLKRKNELMKEFALEFYPLTEHCLETIYAENPDKECYCWPKGWIPWEGVCQ